MSTFHTYVGKQFDILKPELDSVVLRDIAHSLSNTCRFNGHCARFYSVAEHSVHVSHLVPKEEALWGLMHDAAEAYTGDMISPMKSLECFAIFRAIERRIEATIFRRFGLLDKHDPYVGIPASVSDADLKMVLTEGRVLCPASFEQWDLTTQQPIEHYQLACLPPHEAEQAFMERWDQIHGC